MEVPTIKDGYEKAHRSNGDLCRELKSLFGEPYAKSAVSETDEKWIYTYTNGSAHAQSYVVTMKVTTTGTQKTLDVLIRNDVVINYTFSEGPAPGSTTATN